MKEYPGAGRKDVRVRFAPSPTGPIHAGNMRVAVFNWLFARRNEGKFILRIEDTDLERSKMEYADQAIGALEWIGIDWDEGPFFQSQHQTLYSKVIEQLLGRKRLYPCFCTVAQLEIDRKEADRKSLPPVYVGRCRNMNREEVVAKSKTKPFTLRFAVEGENLEYSDAIRGKVKVDLRLIGDFIVRRSDGSVVYNFAAAVDDTMMRISHVMRGEDHISNTPRQIMIMEAMGYEKPVYAHLPLILSAEGKKLSKRDAGTSILELIEGGNMPEAVFNFLAIIGWSPDDKTEEMDVEDLIRKFSLERVSVRSAQYDLNKLKWLNGVKIKKADLKSLLETAKPFIKKYNEQFEKLPGDRQLLLISIVRENIEKLIDLDEELGIFFEYRIVEGLEKELAEFPALEVAEAILPLCGNDDLNEAGREVSEQTGITGKSLFMPLRAALTGRLKGPELKHIYSWFTPQERIERLKMFLEYVK